MSSKKLLILIFIVGFITRFVGLNWGNGYFFHPDENNMAAAISQFTSQNLNPHFYAYGQFPLYLGYFTLKIFGFPNTFYNSVYVLRFWSAVFSFLSLYFFYRIYPKKIFLLFLVFTPGLIQLAHFGTTESLLILVFATNLFLAIYYPRQIFIGGLITGIGLATKISSLIFILPILLANYKNLKNLIFYPLISLFFGLILSPYNLIGYQELLSSLKYETAVATGKMSVFYTNQFLHTAPYVFQLRNIFPYIAGIPIFAFSLLSLIYLRLKSRKFLIIAVPVIIYFLYFGQLYVKWTRFMSPLFFVFPLAAAIFLGRVKSIIKLPLIAAGLLPGLLFLQIYFFPDIRFSASMWINTNIPGNSTILSEAGNVVNIPLNSSLENVTNFDFYNLDNDSELQSYLPEAINKSDYILIPSRRIFKNQTNPEFPYSQKYYQNLFNGQLGFSLLKTFTPSNWIILNPENAEETWSVFDHPTIRLFHKTQYYDRSYYDQIFNQT